jgi:hypothetical protein
MDYILWFIIKSYWFNFVNRPVFNKNRSYYCSKLVLVFQSTVACWCMIAERISPSPLRSHGDMMTSQESACNWQWDSYDNFCFHENCTEGTAYSFLLFHGLLYARSLTSEHKRANVEVTWTGFWYITFFCRLQNHVTVFLNGKFVAQNKRCDNIVLRSFGWLIIAPLAFYLFSLLLPEK